MLHGLNEKKLSSRFSAGEDVGAIRYPCSAGQSMFSSMPSWFAPRLNDDNRTYSYNSLCYKLFSFRAQKLNQRQWKLYFKCTLNIKTFFKYQNNKISGYKEDDELNQALNLYFI